MKTINEEIFKIADQAYVKILVNEEIIEVRHKFSFRNTWNWGLFFVLLGGLILLIVQIVNISEESSTNFHLILGLLLTFYSLFSLAIQYTDEVKIENKIIKFHYNFKRRVFYLNNENKIYMKTEVIKANPFTGAYGYDYFTVTHFLQDENTEIPIFKFQMINEEAEKAKKLGNELTRMLNDEK